MDLCRAFKAVWGVDVGMGLWLFKMRQSPARTTYPAISLIFFARHVEDHKGERWNRLLDFLKWLLSHQVYSSIADPPGTNAKKIVGCLTLCLPSSNYMYYSLPSPEPEWREGRRELPTKFEGSSRRPPLAAVVEPRILSSPYSGGREG